MSHTLVGVFDSRAQAEEAKRKILALGFPGSDVQVQGHPSDTDGVTTSANGTNPETDDGFGAGIRHFFSNLFGDDDSRDSGEYAEAVRRGSAVVAVTVSDDAEEVQRAQFALVEAGAVDINERASAWSKEGFTDFDPSAKPYTKEEVAAERNKVLPVVQEQLEVGKRQVNLGAVRVYSRTVEKPVNETVQLHEQHASIEKRSVDRAATAEDLAAFKGGSIEVRETAEKAVVNKTARVVEEVVVGTVGSTREETVSDTVRNTVVEVERDGDRKTGAMDKGSDAYRDHFKSNYASGGGRYEDFHPAYAYGASLGTGGQRGGRNWDQISPEARKNWESKHPGSDWNLFNGAVRYGWDSLPD